MIYSKQAGPLISRFRVSVYWIRAMVTSCHLFASLNFEYGWFNVFLWEFQFIVLVNKIKLFDGDLFIADFLFSLTAQPESLWIISFLVYYFIDPLWWAYFFSSNLFFAWKCRHWVVNDFERRWSAWCWFAIVLGCQWFVRPPDSIDKASTTIPAAFCM